jgi:hypothetical protein
MNERFIRIYNTKEKKMSISNVIVSEYFIVRDRTTGGAYLSRRRSSTNANQPKYRWAKANRNRAVRMQSYDTAQKARSRYGGEVVRCIKVTLPNVASATIQTVVSAE